MLADTVNNVADKEAFKTLAADEGRQLYGCANKGGLMMNLSEQEQYDGLFPAHSLSMCRELIRTLFGI